MPYINWIIDGLRAIFNPNPSVKIEDVEIGSIEDDWEMIGSDFDTVFKDLDSIIQKEDKEI